MKAKWDAFTDYPMIDGQRACVLRKIRVIDYDDNKYCNVRPFKDDGELSDEIFSVKIGYIKMDPNLSKRPNRKTAASWAGFSRPSKKRVKRTSYEVSVHFKNKSTVERIDTLVCKTKKVALVEAFNLFNPQYRVWQNLEKYNKRAPDAKFSEIDYVMIWPSKSTRNRRLCGINRIFIERRPGNDDPMVTWMDHWRRSHKG